MVDSRQRVTEYATFILNALFGAACHMFNLCATHNGYKNMYTDSHMSLKCKHGNIGELKNRMFSCDAQYTLLNFLIET